MKLLPFHSLQFIESHISGDFGGLSHMMGIPELNCSVLSDGLLCVISAEKPVFCNHVKRC